ncbi:MAG: isopropylmalate isomerase [Croceibacterium sp.]
MTKRLNNTGKAAIAGAIGSAAVAAALLYVNHRKDKQKAPTVPVTPTGELPETD